MTSPKYIVVIIVRLIAGTEAQSDRFWRRRGKFFCREEEEEKEEEEAQSQPQAQRSIVHVITCGLFYLIVILYC